MGLSVKKIIQGLQKVVDECADGDDIYIGEFLSLGKELIIEADDQFAKHQIKSIRISDNGCDVARHVITHID